MSKQRLQEYLNSEQKRYDWWYDREIHAAWNDDGHGRHIKADVMLDKIKARMELLNELISKATF